MKFEKLPDKIDAFQWDGTSDGALSIHQALNELPQTRVNDVVTKTVSQDQGLSSRSEMVIHFQQRNEVRLRPDEWVIVDEFGKADMTVTEWLEGHYKKVDIE